MTQRNILQHDLIYVCTCVCIHIYVIDFLKKLNKTIFTLCVMNLNLSSFSSKNKYLLRLMSCDLPYKIAAVGYVICECVCVLNMPYYIYSLVNLCVCVSKHVWIDCLVEGFIHLELLLDFTKLFFKWLYLFILGLASSLWELSFLPLCLWSYNSIYLAELVSTHWIVWWMKIRISYQYLNDCHVEQLLFYQFQVNFTSPVL